MKIFELKREDGHVFAFEINNAYIYPKKIAELLKTVNGVSNINLRKPFSSSSDIHLQFKYHGIDFIVWEPYGDSSRYWIGPFRNNDFVDVGLLEEIFKKYQPPLIIKFFGDVITLNFKSLFGIK